ncbi:ParB family protein [Ralstonia pseudosolanacearum]|uniref:ParB family protein n=1 Tax=Ralstonia pseudosolanacearum TaxID=1310165 RepID=UPI0040549EDA
MNRGASDKPPQDLASKLLAEGFARSGPIATTPSDPLADTPMVVTLDELRPYELNPRVTRNPLYDDIKASIRQRGLDAPPAITRRPGEPHYVIRNGGNTRLAILGELWSETREERFFRIPCLFRPWSARGEIVALTGHLAENELHGQLTFIERALAVEKARELYEQENPTPLTQSELARRLTQDGYPITQPHISRMQDTVRYLLPAIPRLLYSGIGKPQIERLAALRRAAAHAWEQHGANSDDFPALFQEVLALFDGEGTELPLQRIQDELIGQMAEQLDTSYDKLCLDIEEAQTRQRALGREPSRGVAEQSANARQVPESGDTAHTGKNDTEAVVPQPSTVIASTPQAGAPTEKPEEKAAPSPVGAVPPVPDTERLQSVRQLIADQTGSDTTAPAASDIRTIPLQAGGLYPITDVWQIPAALDDPIPLRTHIAQLAREIAAEAGMEDAVSSVPTGIGYLVEGGRPQTATEPGCSRGVAGLLLALSQTAGAPADAQHLPDDLASLLLGSATPGSERLSDAALIKLYRLIRLARCLHDHAQRHAGATGEPVHGGP